MTLQTLGWSNNAHVQYARNNEEDQETRFELDLESTYSEPNRDTSLSLLIECKYHDLSRFWFFLPHEVKGWYMDDRFLNCGPLQTLREPSTRTFLNLAPASTGGIVVSVDGTKQENSVYTAIQQLVNGFVPFSLSTMFSFNLDVIEGYDPTVTATIPMIVTNASIYRLRPDITDLETIREASSPLDIADELDWTWYFYEAPFELFSRNLDAINLHKDREAELIYRYPLVKERMPNFADRPSWIAIVNIKSLSKVVDILKTQFFATETLEVNKIMNANKKPRKSRR